MHHSRRKSGNTSFTDVRKADQPTRHKPSRRSTPQSVGTKVSKSPRTRTKEFEEDSYCWEEERESFPQYCMSCEKQFYAQDDSNPYCSEACRVHDHTSQMHASATPSATPVYSSPYSGGFYASSDPEPRDIVPRASPSRPTSTHYSSPVATSTTHTSAMEALRSLSIRNDPSPPSPTIAGGYPSTMWPFTRSAAVSPGTSYTKSAAATTTRFSSTYDAGYYGATGYPVATGGMERPLPSRRPNSYARPKSIELLTPAW